MTDPEVLGLVPARGGSKGITDKNVRELGEEPLIAHTIRAGRKAERIGRTVVSTDDKEIQSTAREYGADVPFLRPAELATDDAPTEPVVEHAVDWLGRNGDRYETVVLLQPTSPLRSASNIDEALERYSDSDVTSLVSVYEDHSYRWKETDSGAQRKNYQDRRIRRQEKTAEYVENGAIYVVDVDEFMNSGSLQAGVTALYVMEEARSIDIDDQFDLWLAERVYTEWFD